MISYDDYSSNGARDYYMGSRVHEMFGIQVVSCHENAAARQRQGGHLLASRNKK